MKEDVEELLCNLTKQAENNKPWYQSEIYINHIRLLKSYISYLEENIDSLKQQYEHGNK